MANGIELSPLAPREAIAFFRSKGFAPALQRFDYRDHWREEHARDFVVAKAMQDDVLATIREDLDKAISGGTTLDAFRDGLAPKLGAQGWWGRSVERDPLNGELRDVELGSMRRMRPVSGQGCSAPRRFCLILSIARSSGRPRGMNTSPLMG